MSELNSLDTRLIGTQSATNRQSKAFGIEIVGQKKRFLKNEPEKSLKTKVKTT